MCAFIDRTNLRYGKLTVVKLDRIVKKQGSYWLCKCDCGNETIVRGNTLGKNTNSCGCIKKEQDKNNLGRFINGKMRDRIAKIWYGMKYRCQKESDSNFKSYGKRGISVCDEWNESYQKFEDWCLNNGYQENLTLDRIDVNGNYSPDNCRWATPEEQNNNKTNNRFVFLEGEKMSLKKAHRIYSKEKVCYSVALSRYRNGIRNIDELFQYKKKIPR